MSRLKVALAAIGASAVVAASLFALNITPANELASKPTPSSSPSPSSSSTPTPEPEQTQAPVIHDKNSPIKHGTKVVKDGKVTYYAAANRRDVSAALSSLPRGVTTTVRGPEWANIKALRKFFKPKLDKSKLQGFDPVVQTTATGQATGLPTAAMPTTTAGFNGLGDNFPGFSVNSVPPDTSMDVGLTQIVQVVNTGLVVLSKTGTTLYGPVDINTLWSGFGGGCQNDNDGDPTVAYDRIANRWVISQFAVSHTNNGALDPYLQCVAVSQTSDATGSYYRYAFGYSVFNDYPKLSVWGDAYYTTFNGFTDAGNWSGSFICAYDRAKMLLGDAANQVCTANDPYYGAPLIATVEGSTAPTAGTSAYALTLYDSNPNYLALWRVSVSWSGTPSISKSSLSLVSIPGYTVSCPTIPSWTCVPQKSTTQQLDTLGDRMMYRFVYRKIGTQVSLLASHTVDSNGANSVRWYEFRPSGSTIVKYQAGTYQPDATNRWMPSISMDKLGNIAMVYSSSSSSQFPSVAIAGRLASDALDTLGQGERIVKAGTGSQTGYSRWGDYSAMVVDPADNCTFWSSTEYLATTSAFNWRTWISKFKFANCAPDATTYTVTGPSSGAVGATSSNFTVTPNGAFTGNITVTPSGAGVDTTPIVLNFDGISTSKTFTVTPTETGTVSFTVSNDGGLTDPVSLPSYSAAVLATSFTLTGPTSGYRGQTSGVFTVTPNAIYTGTITITRSGGGVSGTTVLTFNASSAAQTFTITPSQTGTVTLTPTNSGGLTNPSALSYSVTLVPPTISSITASGAIGSTVTITGTNLSNITRVKIGSIGAASFKLVSATSITAVVAEGTVSAPVTLIDSVNQSVSSGSNFSVTYSNSTLTTISPTSAKVGASLTVSGTNLTNVSAVTVDGVSVPNFTTTASKLYVAVPAGVSLGSGKKVAITTPNGVVTSTGSVTLVTGTTAPKITRLSTSRATKGATVTLTGTDFASADAVYFNGVAAPFVVLSNTSILTAVPNATSGQITVHTPGGTSAGSSTFTVSSGTASPSISNTAGAVSYTAATVGQIVYVTGNNLAGLTGVTVNGTTVTSFKIISATQISFVVPIGATTGSFTLTTTGGSITWSKTLTIY